VKQRFLKQRFVMQGLVVCGLLTAACGVEVDDPDTAEREAALGNGPRLVAPGENIALLAVTSDNHAIYQLGQQVFASALGCDTAPELIGTVPAGNTAFVYQVGRVAFVWTNPDRTKPGFGVSPLVIWSAEGGAQAASTASAIGTLAVSATPDGERVLFTTNSPADGTTGDLVVASSDLGDRTTIAAGIPMGFGFGPCLPRAAFLGHDDDIVVAACAAGTTTADLAIWHDGVRQVAVPAIAVPPRLWIDPERARALTIVAGTQHPILVDRHAHAREVADVSARNAFFGGDGGILFLGLPDSTSGLSPLYRATKAAPRTISSGLAGIYNFAFGTTGISSPITSPDGKSILYFETFNPNVGVGTDVILADARDGTPSITLDANADIGSFNVPFTNDSAHALWARFDTTNYAVGPMFEAGPRGTRQYSDDTGWTWGAAYAGSITYNDNTTLDFTNFARTTADLKWVDLSRKTLAPQLIAEQANATYFASHRGHGVVYAIDQGAAAGIYVARVGH
jgi:hypothetical protein